MNPRLWVSLALDMACLWEIRLEGVDNSHGFTYGPTSAFHLADRPRIRRCCRGSSAYTRTGTRSAPGSNLVGTSEVCLATGPNLTQWVCPSMTGPLQRPRDFHWKMLDLKHSLFEVQRFFTEPNKYTGCHQSLQGQIQLQIRLLTPKMGGGGVAICFERLRFQLPASFLSPRVSAWSSFGHLLIPRKK